MRAKIMTTDIRLNEAATVKIVVDGKARYKNVSYQVEEVVSNRNGLEISDKALSGFRKLKMVKDAYNIHSGFYVAAHNVDDGRVFICRRGLRDIGFFNKNYIYVKLGRKSRARDNSW